MPGGVPGSSGVRHFGGGPPACRCYFAESPALPCHLHPRWTLTVAPPPSLSSSLTPSSPASFSLSCQAAAWPAVAVEELDKAPASPARERPPHPRRPKWREGRQLPRPRPLFVWRGGGELRLAPGASWPLPSPPGSLHTALIVCDAPHGCADVEPPPWPPSAQVPVFGKERTLPPRLPGGGGLTGYEAGLTQSVRLISSGGDGTPSSEVLLEALHPYMGVSYSSSACPTAL